MPYSTNYPTTLPTYSDLPTYCDYSDFVLAEHHNDPLMELIACLNALGTLPQGSAATLKDRLTQSLNDDGTIKPPALWTTVPTQATSSGLPGNIAYDDTYLYQCYDTDLWNRQNIAGW